MAFLNKFKWKNSRPLLAGILHTATHSRTCRTPLGTELISRVQNIQPVTATAVSSRSLWHMLLDFYADSTTSSWPRRLRLTKPPTCVSSLAHCDVVCRPFSFESSLSRELTNLNCSGIIIAFVGERRTGRLIIATNESCAKGGERSGEHSKSRGIKSIFKANGTSKRCEMREREEKRVMSTENLKEMFFFLHLLLLLYPSKLLGT